MTSTSTRRPKDSLLGLAIPPRPGILVDLQKELQRPTPDLKAIAALVSRDVGLASAVLQTVNSPFYGLRRKIGSIPQAVQILGAGNVATIVTGLLLRQSVGEGGPSLERFWDSAEKVAGIAAHVAGLLPRVSRDEAYSLGLFRDCGIPLLIRRFPDYIQTLKLGAGDDLAMVKLEDERHGTNHAMVAYMVARRWELPDAICTAIQRHHDTSIFDESEDAGGPATLVALNAVAEHLFDEGLRGRNDHHWTTIGPKVLHHLGLSVSEFKDIEDEIPALFA